MSSPLLGRIGDPRGHVFDSRVVLQCSPIYALSPAPPPVALRLGEATALLIRFLFRCHSRYLSRGSPGLPTLKVELDLGDRSELLLLYCGSRTTWSRINGPPQAGTALSPTYTTRVLTVPRAYLPGSSTSERRRGPSGHYRLNYRLAPRKRQSYGRRTCTWGSSSAWNTFVTCTRHDQYSQLVRRKQLWTISDGLTSCSPSYA